MFNNIRNYPRILLAGLLLAGLAAGGEGLWIYAKAKLAQILLEMSWRSALAGERVKPWPWADTRAIARLTIDRDGAAIIVLAGASGRTMAFGPGHLDGTAMPGDLGNCVITAHRDTHFSALRYVGPGDVITLQRPDGRNVRYRVQATRVVNKSDTSVLRQDSRTRLTLITCYPFDAVRPGTPLRWVVVAQKVG
jgi:sortase A